MHCDGNAETALEEITCCVLGDPLQEEIVTKIALYRCDLQLLASKTIITPKTTTILGWIWSYSVLVNTMSIL